MKNLKLIKYIIIIFIIFCCDSQSKAFDIAPADSAATEKEKTFSLYQNCPNPFNPATVILYELDISNEVTLEVYNVTGRKIATFAQGRQDEGIHSIIFEGSNNESGVYFYKLTVGSSAETKKMLLKK